ncbi:membrane protein FAM174B-like [Colletes gigas]|uniref:membrane protein FAM174B-like n=1 Tax=Colletes gigas TaxID=935657 RepID=UPI001C9B3B1B|nr:membrane protein FAM174B-like [Colletes gigas]XP_043248877.1 membrane protein FAM174B-like [Colletes gigas]XP_043248878.1 membrane protein FAM174B-like [Colletes gigas]
MTRTKIPMIKFFVFLLIFLLAQSAVCNGSFRINRKAPDSTSIDKSEHGAAKKISAQKAEQQNTVLPSGTVTISEGDKTVNNITSKSSVGVNKTVHSTEPREENVTEEHVTTLNAGALKRGLYVFGVLSVLVMAYIVFRSLRLSKTRAQMVRKYGILAHRQDVEMRPLPLDEEDDEDTTVFDASNVLANNVQRQNL